MARHISCWCRYASACSNRFPTKIQVNCRGPHRSGMGQDAIWARTRLQLRCEGVRLLRNRRFGMQRRDFCDVSFVDGWMDGCNLPLIAAPQGTFRGQCNAMQLTGCAVGHQHRDAGVVAW
ncbi:hypothetical protein M569_16611 [Genlisea aurea]|uniref:Uncharacterized protein n=1 Tax=Genlisea aurea TaxID=192259 RepID=S8C170_9LAMI|nr:hypothetical protein M569_16611 [Genlisea aurea]